MGFIKYIYLLGAITISVQITFADPVSTIEEAQSGTSQIQSAAGTMIVE